MCIRDSIYGPYQYTENNDYYELLDHFIEEKFELLEMCIKDR